MKRRKPILEQIAKAADLVSAPLPRQPLVEILGHRRVLVENHCGVTAYGTEEIRIKVKSGQILICGSHLMLAQMTKAQLVITGYISDVHLQTGGMR